MSTKKGFLTAVLKRSYLTLNTFLFSSGPCDLTESATKDAALTVLMVQFRASNGIHSAQLAV